MKFTAFFSISLALALAANAQTNTAAFDSPSGQTTGPARAMSLQDCIQQALAHNLGLQIQRYNPVKALYTLRSDYGGFDPAFSFSAQHGYSQSAGSGFDSNTGLPRAGSITKSDTLDSSLGGLLPWGMTYSLFGNIGESHGTSLVTNSFNNTRGQIGAALNQPLLKGLWIDGTRLTIRLDKLNLKQSDLGLRRYVMDLVTRVETEYYQVIAARENVKVRQKALELAERLLAENKKRVEVGALAPLDEKQAASQVATARADLVSARQALALAQNALKSDLTDNYRDLHDSELEPTETLAAPVQIFNLQESWTQGMTQRPDLLQIRLDLEKAGIQLKYDRNQLFPQLDVFGSYGYNAGGAATVELSDGFRDFRNRDVPFYTYGAKISIPLSLQSERNRFKFTKLTVKQALLTVKGYEQGILTEIDNDIITAKASYERVDATRAAREYAGAALEAEQKKLESGKSTSFFVLQLQRDLTAALSAEISALADYNISLAALALAEGSTLDRRSINVEVK